MVFVANFVQRFAPGPSRFRLFALCLVPAAIGRFARDIGQPWPVFDHCWVCQPNTLGPALLVRRPVGPTPSFHGDFAPGACRHSWVQSLPRAASSLSRLWRWPVEVPHQQRCASSISCQRNHFQRTWALNAARMPNVAPSRMVLCVSQVSSRAVLRSGKEGYYDAYTLPASWTHPVTRLMSLSHAAILLLACPGLIFHHLEVSPCQQI